MKNIVKIFVFIAMFSCDDILEDDITNDTILTLTPSQGSLISGNSVQFSWEHLNGADSYRIQIQKDNQAIEMDSVVSNTYFNCVLDPGDYQWRVKGQNFAYSTSYTFPINFSMEASSDLTDQSVVLQSPTQDLYINTPNTLFSWQSLGEATSYSFEIVKNLNGQQLIFEQDQIDTNSIEIDQSLFDEDSEYIWKVKGVNSTSETSFFMRSLFIDSTPPLTPELTTPEDQVSVGTSVTFNWVIGTDSGNVQAPITHNIQIATDIDFNSIIHSAEISETTLQYNFSSLGTYYWRVSSLDAAGNEGDFSTIRSLTVE